MSILGRKRARRPTAEGGRWAKGQHATVKKGPANVAWKVSLALTEIPGVCFLGSFSYTSQAGVCFGGCFSYTISALVLPEHALQNDGI